MRRPSSDGQRPLHFVFFLAALSASALGCDTERSSSPSGQVDRAAPPAPRPTATAEPRPKGEPGATATPDIEDEALEDEAPTAPAVQLLGRFDARDAAGPKCAWPGCRIVARFEGTRVSVRMKEIVAGWMRGAPSEWDLTIDGEPRPKLVMNPGEADYELARDLPPGEHVVELYKRTEAQNGVTQFLGYDFGDGTLLAPPPRMKRRIEIIGDSQPAAFGVEGVGPTCPGVEWAARWQNFRKSLGTHLASMLHAELAGTVYSGKGIAKNIWHQDKETMPIIYDRALPNDPSSAWDTRAFTPAAIIIMMGGNDFAIGQPVDEGPATRGEFTDAFDRFAVALRAHYPAAHIFLAASPSVSDAEPAGRSSRTHLLAGIAEVVARRERAGDARVYAVVPPVADPSELTGCNGHGSPEYHERVARDLAPIVRAKTGWR